jgi:uncharacterized protein YdhG (YjbR/CyaY superfamily)
MNQPKETSSSIDTYMAAFPPETQAILQKIRTIIHEEAPGVEETIAYGIPTFRLKGNLVHFAGYKKHIGFYPTPSGIEAFQREINVYKHAKGSVQFPLDQPMPYDLIRRMVRFRVHQSQG